VLDPFAGVGSAVLAALKHNRRGMACEKEHSYCEKTKKRIGELYAGTLRYRQLGKPIFKPTGREKVSQIPIEWLKSKERS
jgi:adenine-specific DNA-methyltransferase